MKRSDFLLEEYKALQIGIRQHQTAYFTLENYVFGGMLVVYGVLFGVTAKDPSVRIPLTAWWGVFLLLLIAAIRCWAHYIVVRKLAAYICKIERSFYFDSDAVSGFETTHLKSTLNPSVNLAINALCWLVLLSLSFGLALAKTHGCDLP
jgi:hypothetical protein